MCREEACPMPDVRELKERACQVIDQLRPHMEAIAADIHAHPEVGWDTPRSAGRLTEFLAEYGMEVERGVAGLDCAFRAVTPGRAAGTHPAVCFLAEYDALPGLGHACGHNLIGTVASAAGIAVSKVLQEAGLPGAAYVMGTPFEEGGGGKIIMVDKGVFDACDASLMFHPGGGGQVRVGSPNIAAHMLKFKFYGKSAHSGAAPHEGVNAADAAMLTFMAVNAMRQHVTGDVRIHGIITRGGEAANIVPAYAEVSMSVRALNYRTLSAVVERVRNCARAGAMASGARLEVEEGLTFRERVVLPAYRQVVCDNLPALGLPVPEGDPQTYASADSGNVSYRIPHVTFNLPVSESPAVVPHTPEFAAATNSDMARTAMNQAAKLMAMAALDLLTDPGKLAAIQAQHRDRLAAAANEAE
jgi:amidohydrolase